MARAQGIFLTVEQIFLNVTLEAMAREAMLHSPRQEDGTGADKPLQAFELQRTDAAVQDQIQALAKACGVSPDRVENAYPCTPMQESLVSLSEGNENLSVRQLVYTMDDDVPLDRFQQAWSATARAHSVLRTRICQVEGDLRFTQAVIDEDLLWTHSTSNLSQFLEEDANHLMKLGDRFFRYSVLSNNNRRHFVWTVHHALCDGTSLLAILDDVSARFRSEQAIQPVSFEQFIASTIKTDPSEEGTFWKRILSGIDVTPFPAIPQSIDFHANPSSALEQSINVPARPPFGLTKSLLLRAAWGILLSHHTGTENVVFGAINNG